MIAHLPSSTPLVLLLMATCIASASAHALMSQPRCRGALNTQRSIVPQVMDPSAPIDYCPHCQNCGGVGMVGKEGPWKMYNPFQYTRTGLTMCGDPVGKNDHTSKGQYANPASMPFAATYEAGSVANFEFDFTTNHCGFVSFYLCDVSKTADKDISSDPAFWKANCHELKRVPHAGCESGNDMDCGPIDPKFPGRFVVPCRNPRLSDQVIGGPNGKMAYQIPDIEMSHAVVQSYWMTGNNCNPPDGFMDNYNYPKAWAGCPGDGGSVGGRITGRDCTTNTPEEFLNCADVRIVAKGSPGSGTTPSSSSTPGPESTSLPTYVSGTVPAPFEMTTQKGGKVNGMSKSTTVPIVYGAIATATPVASSSIGPASTGTVYATPDVSSGAATSSQTDCVDCAVAWDQCGGIGYTGPTTCCDSGSKCARLSDYYYQCQAPM